MSREQTLKLGVEVYQLVKKLPPEEENVLVDMMMRATADVAVNFAMSNEADSEEERRQLLSVARGKIAVVETLIEICIRLNYFDESASEPAMNLCAELRKTLDESIS